MLTLPLLLVLASTPDLASSETPEAPAPAASLTPAPEPVPPGPSQRSVGIHIGVNLGLFAVDVQHDRFYGFAAGNLGIPLVTNGAVWSAILGLGYTLPISSPGDTQWMMDLFGTVAPAGFSGSWGATNFYTAIGVGLGFRMLHRSGFTLGFKIPVFGLSFGPAVPGGPGWGATSVGYYYLASAISLPIVSFGYRF